MNIPIGGNSMKKISAVIAFIGIVFSGGHLSGQTINGLFAGSNVVMPSIVGQEEVYETITNYVYEEESSAEQVIVETEETEKEIVKEIITNENEELVDNELNEDIVAEVAEEVESEELTYDQMYQKDVGDEEEIVPPEIMESWYVEETAAVGLELILASYEIPDYSFVIESNPSNYIYQYDFYADSPEGEHANLVALFQFDATGNQTFRMDLVSGKWD